MPPDIHKIRTQPITVSSDQSQSHCPISGSTVFSHVHRPNSLADNTRVKAHMSTADAPKHPSTERRVINQES